MKIWGRLLAGAALPLVIIGAVAAADRGSLWRVAQLCVADERLMGSSFPCLFADLSQSPTRGGYVVLRAPLEKTHIVVVPTARVAGIESPLLQTADAPNFMQNAWTSRRFVQDAARRPLKDDEIGLALNSRPGRSQDQLHIHVDCVRGDVAQQMRAHDSEIGDAAWTHLNFAFSGRRYWAMRVKSETLEKVNLFKIAATLLRTSPGKIENLTFAVLRTPAASPSQGFYLLADQYVSGRSRDGHAEFLLDHSCSGK